jgi:AAA domain
MVGGDENAAKDMGVFVAAADRLRQATGATVLLIHHHGKAGAVRGSTALVAAVDTILEAKRDGTLLTLGCGKQKDAAPFEPIHLVRRVVELGTDEAGQPQSSLVLDPSSPPEADADLPDLQQRVLDMLVDAFGSGGATDAQWRDLCLDEGISRRSFYRVKKGLVEGKRVVALERGRRSIYLPAEQAFGAMGANGAKVVPTGAMAPTPTEGAHGATVPHSLRSGTAGTTGTTGRSTGETTAAHALTNQAADPDGADDEQASLLQREQRALVTLDETFGARGATDAEWRDACIERGQARASYYRAKPVLLARGLVVVEGAGLGARYWLSHERPGAGLSRSQSQQVSPPASLSDTSSETETTRETAVDQAEDLEGGLPW